MFSSSEKSKGKDPTSKKSQFYVQFLGWMECRGLRGQRYADNVIRELRRRQSKMVTPPKLTIQISKKNIKITQEVEENAKKGIKKIKFPTIPSRDVTYVRQAIRPGDGRLDDTVACIYLGYMPRTQKYVHVHVYRFDEASTASLFVGQMSALIEGNMEHILQVEADLVKRGEIDNPEPITLEKQNNRELFGSDVGYDSNDEDLPFFDKEIDPDLQSLKDVKPFDSVTDELKLRFQIGDAPLLLPPKDYDTVSRARGNLEKINKRRCLNLNIVGESALHHERSALDDGAEDLISKTDSSEWSERSSLEEANEMKLKDTKQESLPALSRDRQHSPQTFKDNKRSPQVPHKPDFYESKSSPQVPHKPDLYESKRSPQVPHKPDFYESKRSPQVPHKPDLYESKRSPQVPHKPDFYISKRSPSAPDRPGFLDPDNSYISQNSGNLTPDSVFSGPSGFLYPAKSANSPRSPRLNLQPQTKDLSRHGSQNSITSEGSRRSNRSDDGQTLAPTKPNSNGSIEDIYSVPVKTLVPKLSLGDELPPDYMDDNKLKVPGRNLGYNQPVPMRSAPADIMRSGLNATRRSRPNSEELPQIQRTNSPILLKGPIANVGMYSPQIQRYLPR